VTRPDLTITGEITGETSKQIAAMCQGSGGGSLNFEINSAGGDAFAGIAGFNAIRQHGRVTISVTALAASAAATIALAGATIRMHRNALMMIHSANLVTFGNASEHEKSAAMLSTFDGEYVRMVAQVTGHPEARVRAWLEAETWMTAEEAVELNFADEIIETGEADLAPVARSQRDLLSQFRHVPGDLAALADRRAARQGAELAAMLTAAIERLSGDERAESSIIAELADAAGIEPDTVRQILAGSINCPPVERLEAFATVLGLSAESLVEAGNRDGCDYQPAEEA
jgi:ATP-dependent protease ClpP protease subunit/transcriptional regulator with XRE-family HTH domain